MKKTIVVFYFFITIHLFPQEGFYLLTTMSGDSVGDQFSVVSHIGDINVDGFDDVIVGAPGGDYVKLFFGGEVFDTIPDLTFRDYKQYNCQFGCSIAGDGDVNGDGYPDIIIGASSTWIGPSCPYECFVTGAAYVYFGGPTIDTTADLTLIVGDWLTQTGWYYGFGKAVTIPGDLNADGYDDIVISAPNDVVDAHGRVYIYYGGTHLDDQWDILLEGEEVCDNFGFSLSKVGDLNNDGFDDVLIGAPMFHNNIPNKIYQGGKAYLIHGGNEISLINSVEFTGDTSSFQYGRFISGLGDVNGDSINDFGIMGGQYFKIVSGINGNILLEISRVDNWFGNFLNICGGIINNDNLCDIIISLEDTSNQYAGKVEIYLGRTNLNVIPDYMIDGIIPNRGLGTSIAIVGDLNNDNKNEIGIGEWYLGYPDTMGSTKTYIYSFGELNDINDQDNNFPKSYELYQNYPNPFNSSTIIKYSIPRQEQVTLKIYDQLGRLVTTLVNGKQNAGVHQVEFKTESIASGVYLYKLQAGDFVQSKKMVLLK
jgi:hypothetical protein